MKSKPAGLGILVLAIIGLVIVSGCVTEERPPIDGEKTGCPYECCDDGAYKYKECPDGYKCKENKCVKGEDGKPEEKEDHYYPEADTSISWVSMNGPPGGRIKALMQNPSPPHELYAMTVKGMRKSVDKGESWQLMGGSQSITGSVHSMAFYGDKIFFVCDDGFYYYDSNGNPVKISGEHFGAITVSDNKLFVKSGGGNMGGIRISYADLASWEASGNFDWKDISISESELKGLVLLPGKGTGVHGIVAIGNRILAGVNMMEGGRGELSKSYLYVSEDLGETWSMVEFGTPDGVIISKIVQNPDNPQHIVVAFKHNIVHDELSPLSELLRESYDGGKTWNPVTDLASQSNGVEDVVISGSAYYILCPYGGPRILKMDGSSYEEIPGPRLEEFGQVGFNLDTLLIDYENPNIAYGKTGSIWALGMLKSEDGMKTWKKMDSDIVGTSPTIVMTHPTDPNVVFTSGNVIQESYVTRNFGNTWEPFTPVSAGDDVKIDPHNPDHILLADEMTTIYESFDAGRTFTHIAQDFSSAKIFDFEITKDSGSIYASNIGVGISEASSQGGWRYLTYSPDYTYDIEIDPEDSNIVYATYSPKIFESHSSIWKYSKNQNDWSEIFRLEDSRGVTSLAIDELNPDNMYAGVVGKEGKIYYSNDKGGTWDRLNEDFFFSTIHSQNQMAIDPTNENTVYATPWGAGVFKTLDGGATWTEIENIPTLSVASLVVDPTNPNIIYAAGRAQPYLYKSTDAGQTWQNIFYAGLGYSRLFKIKLDPGDPNTIYVSAFKHNAVLGGLFKISYGVSTDITGSIPRAIIDIAVDPTDSRTIYVSLHGENIYKTANGGITWQNLDAMPIAGVFDIEIDPSNPNILYAAAIMGRRCPEELLVPELFPPVQPEDIGPHGVYKSENGGLSWTNINQDVIKSPVRALAFHPTNSNVIYAAGAGGVYLTTDGGESWTAQNTGLDYKSTGALVVSNNKIYAGTRGGGVYVSDISDADYSVSWTATDGPKPEIFNIQIIVDPTDSNVIYASSYPGGLFKTMDGGITWKDKNFFLPSFEVDDPVRQGYYRFAIDPNDPNRLYFATYEKGVYISNDGANSQMPLFGDNREMRGKPVTDIVIDPADSNTIHVASEEGVFVTKDAGKTWEEMNDGLKTLNVRSLKIASTEYPPLEDDFEDGNADGWKADAGWSVIQEGGNYVLKGTGHNWINSGSESWTDYTFESKIKLVKGSVHVNYRVSGGNRYAIGINDWGMNLMRGYEGVHTNLKNNDMSFSRNRWYDIKITGKGNNIKVYVDDDLRIDYTDNEPVLNGGIAFESLPDSEIHVDDIAITIDSSNSEIYAGTAGYGIYKFNHASQNWQNLGKGIFGGGWWSAWERRMYQFSSILFDPDVPGRVYFGHFPSGFFISEDNGHTWRDSSLGLGNDGMFSLSMHPHNHSILFAGTYNGVVKSLNKGRTWEIINNGMPSEQWPYTVAIDSNNPNIMYTSTKNGQNMGFCERNQDTFCGIVMKTTDGGDNWFRIMNGLYDRSEFYTLLIYPLNHNILFLSTNVGVYISRDAGASWKIMNSGLPGRELTVDNQVRDNVADNLALTPDNKYLIFGLTEYGVWKADLSGL